MVPDDAGTAGTMPSPMIASIGSVNNFLNVSRSKAPDHKKLARFCSSVMEGVYIEMKPAAAVVTNGRSGNSVGSVKSRPPPPNVPSPPPGSELPSSPVYGLLGSDSLAPELLMLKSSAPFVNKSDNLAHPNVESPPVKWTRMALFQRKLILS